jgi:cytochrome c556
MRQRRTLATLAMASLVVLVGAATVRAASTPEDTVRNYLKAMQGGKYEDAYKQISKAMAGGKDAEAWSKEQKYMMQSADVHIFKFDVYPAKVEGETAKVPNILSSQDKFLNQLGADEYELYSLVKENGDWKIDQQEQVDKSDQAKWFTKKSG